MPCRSDRRTSSYEAVPESVSKVESRWVAVSLNGLTPDNLWRTSRSGFAVSAIAIAAVSAIAIAAVSPVIRSGESAAASARRSSFAAA